MNDQETMVQMLGDRDDAVALACMDTRSGLLLGLHVRGGVEREEVELATLSAAELYAVPLAPSGEPEPFDEGAARWVHAYARVPRRRDLVVVGLAHADSNVSLLREWIRQVAEQMDASI